MTNKKQQRQVKPKQTKRKSSTVTVQILKGVSLDIQSHVEDMIAEHVGMLWDKICERNRAAEETLRRELALHEHAKIERNTLLAQRGAEIQELKGQLSSCEEKLSGALQELEQVRKIHRLPQMVQLELDSLRKELDKERAAARAVRAHAEYTGEQLRRDMAKREAEKDFALVAANEEIESLKKHTHLPCHTCDELNRERADHFATKIALRDALRAAERLAMEAASYAAGHGNRLFAEACTADVKRFGAARAALGLDEITMPPAAAGETVAPEPTVREFGASKVRVREIAVRLSPESTDPNPVPPAAAPEPASDLAAENERLRAAIRTALEHLPEPECGDRFDCVCGHSRGMRVLADALLAELAKPKDGAK